MKEKLKKIFNLSNILGLISILLNTYLLNLILKLDMVPVKYVLVIAGIIYIFNILFIVFSKVKKKLIRVIGYILLIITIVFSMFGSFYLNSTTNFIDNAFSNATNIHTTTYYVVAKSDSNYKELEDIKTKEIAYYTEDYNIKKAYNKLIKKVSVTEKTYQDLITLFNDVNANTTELMLITKSSFELITTLDNNYSKDNYKVIYKINVSEKIEQEKQEVGESFNIFIGGKDFTNNNMDFNMIVTVNTKTHKVLLTSIPRDYYIEVDGYDGKKDTLSYMGALGINTNMNSVAKLFNTDINYYISLDTTGLVELVDAVGGINYCSEHEYTTTHAMVLDTYNDSTGKKLYVKKGCQHLNGIQTLTVARERNAFDGRDRQRQKNCQAIIIDIIEQLVSTNTLTNYNNILNSVSNLYQTTVPKEIVTSIIKDTVENGNNWTFESQSVNGEDTHDYVHMTNLKDWVMYPDMNTVNSASIKIEEVLNTK